MQYFIQVMIKAVILGLRWSDECNGAHIMNTPTPGSEVIDCIRCVEM